MYSQVIWRSYGGNLPLITGWASVPLSLWSIAISHAFGYTSLAKGGNADGSEEKSLRHDPGSAAQPAPAGAGAAGPDLERLCGKAHQRTF